MPDHSSVAVGPKLGKVIYADVGANFPNSFRTMLRALDQLVQCSVKSRIVATPPVSPADGDAYIVPASPTGAWVGQTGKIATYSLVIANADTNVKAPGWEFYTPKAGWFIYSEADSGFYSYSGSAWAALTMPGVELTANKNAANGYAGLDASTKVANAQMPTNPSFTGVVGNTGHLLANGATDLAPLSVKHQAGGPGMILTNYSDADFRIDVTAPGASPAFTKLYSAAGSRLGFGVSSAEQFFVNANGVTVNGVMSLAGGIIDNTLGATVNCNSSTPTGLGQATSCSLYLLRDNVYGGSAFAVLVDGAIVLPYTYGNTHFVLAAPAAAEIQLGYAGAKLTVLGGSSRASTAVRFIQIAGA